MLLLPLHEITVLPDRQRRVIDESAILDLANDIERVGLLHPVVINARDKTLIAGERRLRAIELLHVANRPFECGGVPVAPPRVPVTEFYPNSDDPESHAYEAELIENIARQDLSWQEVTAARAKLHELRKLQSNNTQTLKQTAEEIARTRPNESTSAAALSQDVMLADFLNDEAVAHAPTKKEALRIIERKAREEKAANLADEWKGLVASRSPHILHHGDAFEIMAEMPPRSFDVILTDPPYGVDANSFGDQAWHRHTYEDDEENWKVLINRLGSYSYRLAKPQAHAYIFVANSEHFIYAKKLFARVGWDVWSRPLIWYKGNLAFLPRPKHGPRYTYECILYAIKGGREVLRGAAHDVLTYPSASERLHAAEKPVDLFTDLLSRSAMSGDTVLDPFCGSGPIFSAAHSLHLDATGIELDDTAHNTALQRITELDNE